MPFVETSQPLPDPLPQVGYALFATRIGACALAWHAQGVLALQLPEATTQQTVDRMLGELAQRLAGSHPWVQQWRRATHVQDLPDCAWQAVAGVQQLLEGWRAQAGLEDRPTPAWGGGDDAQVLGDARVARPGEGRAAAQSGGLPSLQEIVLDGRGVPDFARSVYALTWAIPPGQTRTYGDLAQDLGGPRLARAVGQALGANPFAPVVPCHRVLAAGREPGGFSGGQGALTKLRMLELEGAAWGGTRSLFE